MEFAIKPAPVLIALCFIAPLAHAVKNEKEKSARVKTSEQAAALCDPKF